MRMILVVAILGIMSIASQADAQSPPPKPEAPPAFVAPSITKEEAAKLLAELEQEYEKRIAKLPDTTDGRMLYDRNSRAMHQLIRERFEHDAAARRRLVGAVATAKDGSFGYGVLQDTVYLLKDCQERELLVWLLSRNCPNRMFRSNIECALIIIREDKIPDGVLVLCDAYEKSQDRSAKEEIYNALERAFRSFRLPSNGADEYVQEVRKWYLKNRDAYEPNNEYLNYTFFAVPPERREAALAVKGTNAKRLEERTATGTQKPPTQ